MNTIDLGKLRFNFAGQYQAGVTYGLNDCVAYGGNVYVYSNPLNAAGNLPTDATHWTLMLQGVNFRGTLTVANAYRIGDLVEYGGVSYLSRDDNTGQAPSSASPHWAVLAEGFRWMGAWVATSNYDRNDIVQYGGVSYIAGADTPASAVTPSAGGSWAVFANGVNPTGAWAGATSYKKNDLVQYGGATYIASVDVASGGAVPSANAAWVVFSSGVNFTGVWAAATAYKKGDAASYNGSSYVAMADVPANQSAPALNGNWTILASGLNPNGAWSAATAYKKNDVVTYGASTYSASQDIAAAGASPSVNAAWQLFASGVRPCGPWSSSTFYLKNDLVQNAGSSYVAIMDHTASFSFNADSFTKWQLFSAGGALTNGYGLPAQPAAGQFQFYARKQGGRTFAEVMGDDGIASKLMMSELEKSVIQIQPNVTTTLSTYGNTTTNVGTLATPAISAANWRRRTTFTASVSAGNGFFVTQAPFLRGNAAGMGGLFCYMRFDVPTAASNGQPFFAGIGPAAALGTGAVSAVANLFGVGFDPGDSSNGAFNFISTNGAGAQTKSVISGMNRANSSYIYDLYIWSPPSPDANGAPLYLKLVEVTTGQMFADTSVAGSAGPALGTLLTPRLQGFDAAGSNNSQLSLYGLYAEGP